MTPFAPFAEAEARRSIVWDWMTNACRDGEGEHRKCLKAPADIETETLIVHGGLDDGRFVRNYEVWHDAEDDDVVRAGVVCADPDTLQLIWRLRELMRGLLRSSTMSFVGDEEALIALIVAGYEHLILDGNYRRARFDYK